MQLCSWLRYYVTNRIVTGSIPDGAIGFLSVYLIPPSRTMVLSPCQSLTKMSTS
jgi:hypothetical protein